MAILRRRRSASALLAACLLALTGCASTTAGTGSGSGTVAPASPTVAPPTGPSGPPSTNSSTSSTSTGSSCSADFCDDFSSKSSGWDTGNEHFFFSAYDPYQGGTFRMGERHDSILTVPAPYDITKAAHDYSVQVDTQMYLAADSPADAIYGISCWNHKTRSGQSSAFLFYVMKSGVQIALWDDIDGTEHILKKKSWSNVLRPAPSPNSIRVLCLQRTAGGRSLAELGVAVNGNFLTDFYAKSTKNHPWSTGDRVALLVGLTGSDVFYDNFTITGECKGSSC